MNHFKKYLFAAIFSSQPLIAGGESEDHFPRLEYIFPSDTHSFFMSSTPPNPLHNQAIYEEKSRAKLTEFLSQNAHLVNQECRATSFAVPIESNGRTPLLTAIHARNIEGVRLLLKHGAYPNQICGTVLKRTALIYSIMGNEPEITELLIQNGANPNFKTDDAHPLFQALQYSSSLDAKSIRIIEILLKSGVNPVTAQLNDQTIFMYMAERFPHFTGKSHQELYKKAGRALVAYKKLALDFQKNFKIPLEICHRILYSADFGLEQAIAKCAICYDERCFQKIPCSKNTHTDSICSDCITQLESCPLCREKLTK
jgi:hypothetical protein